MNIGYSMSNAIEKMKNKMIAFRDATEKKGLEVMPDNVKAPDEVIAARWEICSTCEYLYTPTNTCKVCGCFMKIKTGLANQKCPKNKWLKVKAKTE